MFVAVGYDSVIAVLVTYVATQIGFGSSWKNPFSVGIAQGIAGIDVFSGAGFRMVMLVVFTALGCGMTMFYASKIKKTPTISIAYKTDSYFREQNEKTVRKVSESVVFLLPLPYGSIRSIRIQSQFLLLMLQHRLVLVHLG